MIDQLFEHMDHCKYVYNNQQFKSYDLKIFLIQNWTQILEMFNSFKYNTGWRSEDPLLLLFLQTDQPENWKKK